LERDARAAARLVVAPVHRHAAAAFELADAAAGVAIGRAGHRVVAAHLPRPGGHRHAVANPGDAAAGSRRADFALETLRRRSRLGPSVGDSPLRRRARRRTKDTKGTK